ncbi:hypothetical protein RJT34_11013 [Clitoria ternatea]|uniref:Uncharacterized protein n=1 Tax=Clitoria ternatea TaxID=43366 RepID=A0AAN9JL45_CLITE
MVCTSPRTTTRDRKLDERIKMIQSLDIDKIYTRTMMESINLNPERYKDEHFAAEERQNIMRGLKEMEEQAQNPSAALEDKSSILSRSVETIEKEPVNGDPVDVGNGLVLVPLPHGVGLPMDQIKFHADIGVEPSTSGEESRGCVRVYANSKLEEVPFYVSDPQKQEIMDELFREGMAVGLVEAQKSFPNLNIEAITSNFGLNKGLYRIEWGTGVSGNHVLLPPEEKIHMEGVIHGLLEAKVSFPDLDVPTTANTVLRRRSIELDLSDFTAVKAPSSHVGETSRSGDSQMDFYKGVMDGLVEAHKSLSSLDVNKTASAALDKRKRVAIWSVPKGEEGNASSTSMIPPDEVKLYVEGIMNGLLEAKLGFLDLDVRAILNTVLDERNIKLPFVPFLLVSELDWNTVMPPPLKQFFYKGMQDALVEAQKAFPDLNIDTTFSEASINVPRAAYTLFGEAHDQLVPVEMKISIDGIVSGLHQAKLSFPDLDVEATLVATLHRQDSPDPKQQEMMDEMFCTGMCDALVEAQKRFPNLDIDTAFRAVLISGERHTLKLFEEGRKRFPVEIKIYIEGILSGLGPVKLSFPSLDIWAILNILLNRKGYAERIGPPMALPSNSDTGHPSSDDPLLEAFIMMNQQESESEEKPFCGLREKHKALRKKFEEIQAAPDKDAIDTPSWKTQYDELIEKFNTKPAHEFVATSSKYDKVGAILKGRAKELKRLCDDGIEGYKKSQVFQDLMSAMYLDGLRDGFLEAQTILLAAGIPQEENPSPQF